MRNQSLRGGASASAHASRGHISSHKQDAIQSVPLNKAAFSPQDSLFIASCEGLSVTKKNITNDPTFRGFVVLFGH